MKKLVVFLILLFSSILVVDASSISNIDFDIYVDNYGDATVVETWDARVNQGTEGWHPYYNLGNSVISDVLVSMDGVSFTTVDNWNENLSLKEKANKAGLYYPSDDEVDVVFGITSYGSHKYRISYKISNFVASLEDADMIYWNLFPSNFSLEPGNVDITIYSDFRYDDDLPVWGYGKYGAPCYVYDGKIEMTSDNSRVSSSEYMTILVKFPRGTFQTNNILDSNFDTYFNMAEEGAVNYNGDKTNYFEFLITLLVYGFMFLVIFFTIMSSSISKNDNYYFGETGNKVRKGVPNFRDIPCNKDIYRAYWVAVKYNLISKKENFLGTILLKWIHDGNVEIEKVTKKGLFKETVNDNIIFVKSPDDAIELEKKLYRYMYEASIDGKLESNEFKKWCSSNYQKILNWFDDIIEYETKMLINEGKIVYQLKKKFKISKYGIYVVDSSMMSEAEEMAGLKNFLKEFSRIKEREPIEVHLWNEYLMYAQIFGMADEVAKQFEKLYPEVMVDMNNTGYTYSDIMFVRMLTADGISSASAARSRANSYNAGGGGFSSSGGGGGSFGGGGGGGGFR